MQLGGCRPYPIVNICDMALKTDQLYFSHTEPFLGDRTLKAISYTNAINIRLFSPALSLEFSFSNFKQEGLK